MDKEKIIFLVGGGSGGHLTPLVAIANTIAISHPEIEVHLIGQKGENLTELTNVHSIRAVHSITAGKFRRYNGESLWSHLKDYRTLYFNFRDLFRFLRGILQSFFLLKKIKPDAILLKGGFVCVPVGVIARLLRIPYITHDSDAIPGLANRLTAKNAVYNTTAMPIENYPYSKSKAIQIGIPLRSEFKLVDKKSKQKSRNKIGFGVDDKILLLLGGGNGSQDLNKTLARSSAKLFDEIEDLKIIHQTGIKLFDETKAFYLEFLSGTQINSVECIAFTPNLHDYSAAADIIIARAGATTIAEVSVQQKACIFVPNPFLTGGQQLHNAKILADNKAAIIIDDDKVESELTPAVIKLMADQPKRLELANNISKLYIANSEVRLANLLIDISSKDK